MDQICSYCMHSLVYTVVWTNCTTMSSILNKVDLNNTIEHVPKKEGFQKLSTEWILIILILNYIIKFEIIFIHIFIIFLINVHVI